jgi:glycerol-3-phosphate dehydrogenase
MFPEEHIKGVLYLFAGQSRSLTRKDYSPMIRKRLFEGSLLVSDELLYPFQAVVLITKAKRDHPKAIFDTREVENTTNKECRFINSQGDI